ncbi:hypothetical protein FA13DRAFT_1715896 [Coprinellus micaceus]|uniref:Fungal-type protein kinase domain-containing protein n=1 Tax=Coprinellus micaceus TaxID=71717 RepID=A0A4Y7SLH5_COPMI|nr:hypothetical protein FA13DRAFT_1715896 [Coprinellus micaceus]
MASSKARKDFRPFGRPTGSKRRRGRPGSSPLRWLPTSTEQRTGILRRRGRAHGGEGYVGSTEAGRKATRATNEHPVIAADCGKGKPVFQSMMVLDSYKFWKDKIPHDYLDNLDEAYAHALYLGEVQDDDAATFLEKNEAYDTHKRQCSIPSKPTTRGDLVDTVFKIIQSVIGVFVRPTQQGVEREVVEMDRMPEVEQKDESTPEYTALVVRAAGPSFEAPPAAVSSSVGFGNIATYISVKLDSGLGDAAEILDEMVPYAWHIFREQPNRIHVRSLIVTEKHARLVHFDRAGSQITPPIDIHEHPETLVRLVAGLSSINERTLGLDDSIQWTIVAGRKSQGTLTTTGPSGERKTFPMLEQIPIPRDWINPDTQEEFVVKDSWRPGDRVAEYELLELAKGVPGVVQMVAYEPGRGETKDFRCPSTAGKFLNRIATCLTMKCCGGLIESFKSTLQLLCALCDAIAVLGHQRLVGDDIRILHRDISPNNILLGRDDASEGDRGVLIDFDLAFKATAEHPVVVIDHNIGTRVFQSLSVVESFCIRMNKHQHDDLDDLESFLYVLTYIFLCFRPDGSCVPSKDESLLIISEWAAHDPETAASNKRCLFGFGGGLRHRIRGGRVGAGVRISWIPSTHIATNTTPPFSGGSTTPSILYGMLRPLRPPLSR